MIDPKRYIRENILALEPYSTARDEFKGGEVSVWLDANESPYPNGVNRYPDPHQRVLKKRISEIYGMPVEMIFLGGAGSDEAIDLTYRIFCTPGVDNAIAVGPSYGVYKVAAEINDVEFREVALGYDFTLPVEALLEAADTHSKLIWICSPNNPTGNAFPVEDILRVVERFDGMVVVDEAYADFSEVPSLLPYIMSHPNLIVLRTFSKAWGMAGMRAGMAFSVPEINGYYGRVKYPYNMSGMIQEELLARLDERPDAAIAEIKQWAGIMQRELAGFACVRKVYPTDANFILVKVDDADALYSYLVDNGVIVRNRSRLPGCASTLRITVGTPEENRRTLKLIDEYRNITCR